MLQNSLLKVAVTKAWALGLPLGIIALGIVWVRQARDLRSASSSRYDSGGTRWEQAGGGLDVATARGQAAGVARPEPRERPAPMTNPESSSPDRTNREALLRQIIEYNVRLREALM